MDTEKKKTLADFSRRALQRLKDKKIPKRQTLHIPSMDMELTIRSLDYGEIMECMTLEDNGDIKRSDKYSIYLAAVEPNLRDVAREIMGQEAGESVRMTAFVKCAGDCEKAGQSYEYTGVKDCKMAALMQNGGSKTCTYGCLGYGSCVKVCPFDAIHIVNGIAKVDKEKCKACGKCVAECPKKIIELIPYDQKQAVACSSKDKGKAVMSACEVGCIGCRKCVKECPKEAITVVDNVAHIDPEKCINCGKCKATCPRKIIV